MFTVVSGYSIYPLHKVAPSLFKFSGGEMLYHDTFLCTQVH